MDELELRDALQATLRSARFDHAGIVNDLRQLSGGASRQTWAFLWCSDASTTGERLVVQLQDESIESAALSSSLEANLLRHAHDSGVHVPVVVVNGSDDEHFSTSYIIVTMLEGEAAPARLFKDPSYAHALNNLANDAAVALERIHALDYSALELPRYDLVDEYRRVLDEVNQPQPVLEWAHRWLIHHRPSAHEPVVVHGDFRLGNLMLDEHGLVAVMDWELAHLGDHYEDLAWPLVRAWRFDHFRPSKYFPDRDVWIDAYARATGVLVDRETLLWWEIACTFKWAVICLHQFRRHLQGSTRSTELALIGRRVTESEYDLLRLIP
jgi:aminoglycoside phosphotransferase (APT) family kinase protein